jgi:type IV pilus assembly protein PilN
MNVRLNLATKPIVSHRRFFVGSGVAAAVAGILFLLLGWHAYSELKSREALRRKEQENGARAASLQRRRQQLDEFFARPENAKLTERSQFVKGIVDERAFDWTQMFMDLEKLVPTGVHVISIQPQLEKGHILVRLAVAASSEDGKIKFLKAIETSPAFSGMRVNSVRSGPNGADQALLDLSAIYARS